MKYKVIEINADKFSEKEKEQVKYMLEKDAERLASIYVTYEPSCGCEYVQDALLDRFPMSEKILSVCEICKKGILLKISDPIQFYLPLTEQSFSLEDLKTMVINETRQSEYLKLYQTSFTS
jgi:hypothetical protein